MHDAHALEVLVLIGLTVVGVSALATKLGWNAPVLLLGAGAALAFVPPLEDVELPPEVVLFLFLPALLFWEAMTTSLREIRTNLRVILLQSTLLVVATAAAVAVAGHWLGLSWPVAWVLGAVLAPTDATAIATITAKLPRRFLTTIRAESLINDGTALVIFGIAVSIASGESSFSWVTTGLTFVLSYGGGIATGLVAAVIAAWTRAAAPDALVANSISIVMPFATYLIAEQIHASGVVAVVVLGLTLSQSVPRLTIPGHTRLQGTSVWSILSFLLNGSLFVLVGLQVRGIVEGLSSASLWRALGYAAIISVVVIGVRLAWANTVPYIVRAVDRRPEQRARRISARHRVPMAWAGFRGGVSLAAALAVPLTTESGAPLVGRDLILLVTFVVIGVTLVVQGLTLPAVLRWSHLPEDDSEAAEHLLAERRAAEAALAALDEQAELLAVGADATERVRADLEAVLDTIVSAEHGERAWAADSDRRLRLALLDVQRAEVVRLRDISEIDDIVLRRSLNRINVEEVRLTSYPEGD